MFQTSIGFVVPFLFIQVLFQLSFNVSRIVLKLQENITSPQEPLEPADFNYFISVSGDNYQQMFGENPDVLRTNSRALAYFLSSFFINIVGLNLLISIITENYNRVTSRLNSIDYKARLEQIRKNEQSKLKLQPELANNYSRQFLHIIKYAEDAETESAFDTHLEGIKCKLENV